MKSKWLLTLSIVIASLSASASDDLPPGTGENDVKKSDVAGGVYHQESKKPLGNVNVIAYSNNKKEKAVVTDAQGNFSFEDLKPGTYKFVFEKDGFKKVTREKTISRVDEACQLNISMEEHNSFDFMPGPSSFFDFDK
jgi:hypothetical protein